MGLPVLLAVLFLFSPLLNAPKPEPAKFEDAVYVYSAFRGAPACGELVRRLKALPLRSTVILSVEGQEGFLLDSPDGESQLTCALSYLRDTSRWGKALFLQDPVFLERPEESGRRAALLAAFVDRHPGLLLGAQVDLEPHTTDRWTKIDDRRAVMHDLHDLLSQVRQRLNGLPLGVAVPWWYPTVADEVPQASLESLSGVADEIYLMVYGSADGPVVGGTADRVLAHVDAPLFFMGGGRIHVVLATYEFPSPRELETEMAKVRIRLAIRPHFAGTAVFHAESAFGAPLLRLVSGVVTDESGRGLAGVDVTASGIRAQSDSIGRFHLSGLPSHWISLSLQKPGFQTRTLSIELRDPGHELELKTIPLEKSAARKAGSSVDLASLDVEPANHKGD